MERWVETWLELDFGDTLVKLKEEYLGVYKEI